MAHFAFATWDGGGNFAVALALGVELRNRGHRVTVLGPASLRRAILDTGLDHVDLGVSPPSDPSARSAYLVEVVGSTKLEEQLPATLAAVRPDALIVDCNLSWALERDLSLPVAVLVHTALGLYLPVWQKVIDAANERRSAIRLKPFRDAAVQWATHDLLLITSVEAFDRIPTALPRNSYYVGLVSRNRVDTAAISVARRPATAPQLVVISYSTDRLQNNATRVQTALDALADSPVRVLATTSRTFDPALLSIPRNADVVEDLNLRGVMSSAAVAVVHAGHGTTLSALCQGVPLVCVPGIGRDQIPIAGRVAELGLGIAVPETAGGAGIRDAVSRILDDASFRKRCLEFMSHCSDRPGAAVSADLLEQMLGVHTISSVGLWDTAFAEATLPAQDLERARSFYAERLGLIATSETETGIHYIVGGTRFRLFRSGGSASGSHTQLALMVDDIDSQVRALRERGLEFEEYDYPNLKTVGGIADLGYARAAWFKDSEGNILGIAELAKR